MREQWNCPICGNSCPRHWNMQRHIDRCQPGSGQRPVKYTRPNNMQFKTPLASYYAPYHNPFRQYPPIIKSSNFFPHGRTLERPREKEEKRQQDDDYIERWNKKFRQCTEFLDHLQNFSNRSFRRFPNNMTIPPYDLNSAGIVNTDKYPKEKSPVQSKNHVTPAFKAIVCDQCLTIKALTPDTYKQILNPEKSRDFCSPERLLRAQQLTEQEKTEQLVELHKILPESMMSKVKQWTNDKPYLLAGKYPYPLENCSAELTVNRFENKWYIRAIIDGRANLTDEELLDFLHKSKGSTCANMKIILEPAALQSYYFRHKMGSQLSPHLPPSRLIQYYWIAVCPFEVLSTILLP
jgi:hypothetical protein